MNVIPIITERLASLSYKFAQKNNIHLIPVNIIFKNKVFKDDNDLKANKFLNDMLTSDEIPSTAVPSIGQFYKLLKEILKNYKEGIYISASSKLSGIYNAVFQASRMLKEEDINLKVFDSYSVVSMEGMYAYEALNLTKEGKDIDTIFNHLEDIKKKRDIVEYGVLETLKYLEKNGRIGKAKAWIANLFSFKPIISAKDGVLEPIAKVRTNEQALKQIISRIKNDLKNRNNKKVKIMFDYGLSIDYLKGEAEPRIKKEFNADIISYNQISIAVACHLGPSVWGVCVKYE
jgi:DegV family protein with EDD domain